MSERPGNTPADGQPDAGRKPLPEDHPLTAKNMLRDAAEVAGDVAMDLFYWVAMVVGIVLAFLAPIAAIVVGGLLVWRAFNTGRSKTGPVFMVVLAILTWVNTGSPLGALSRLFGG